LNEGRLLMIAAPSGAGKSSLVSAFLARNPEWIVSISTTTRAPRPGEQDGREYFFTTAKDFVARRDAGEFLEWAEVHGNFYGTSKAWIQAQREANRSVILEIDWQGAQQIRQVYRQPGQAPRSIFILPPSLHELESRLRSRRQDSEEVIQRRLAAAADEMSHAEEFDYVIINQDFSVALQELEQFVQRSWPAPTSR
jgi:guanylate kinase